MKNPLDLRQLKLGPVPSSLSQAISGEAEAPPPQLQEPSATSAQPTQSGVAGRSTNVPHNIPPERRCRHCGFVLQAHSEVCIGIHISCVQELNLRRRARIPGPRYGTSERD